MEVRKIIKSSLLTFFIIVYILLLSACGGGSGSNAAPGQVTEIDAYNSALADYNAANYNSAVTRFNSFIATYPSSTLLAD
ncbi:hypothetical protein, partial [Kaarinaea lacus]